MALAIDIIVAYILGFWFILLMGSAMCFGGPGATNDFKCIFKVLGALTYPTWIFLVYLILGIEFFHFNALDALITSVVVIIVLFSLFGYTRLFFNALRGINSEGYTVKGNRAYYDGAIIKTADAKTFQ